jgi:hypothetical protein
MESECAGTVEPSDLTFPVLCLSRDSSVVPVRDLEDLCRCNALAFWRNQYYRDLRVLDVTGSAYTVVEARLRRPMPSARRFLARLTNQSFSVKLRLRAEGPPSLATAKERVSEWLDKAPEFWEAADDLDEWKRRISTCETMADLIAVFE